MSSHKCTHQVVKAHQFIESLPIGGPTAPRRRATAANFLSHWPGATHEWACRLRRPFASSSSDRRHYIRITARWHRTQCGNSFAQMASAWTVLQPDNQPLAGGMAGHRSDRSADQSTRRGLLIGLVECLRTNSQFGIQWALLHRNWHSPTSGQGALPRRVMSTSALNGWQ